MHYLTSNGMLTANTSSIYNLYSYFPVGRSSGWVPIDPPAFNSTGKTALGSISCFVAVLYTAVAKFPNGIVFFISATLQN